MATVPHRKFTRELYVNRANARWILHPKRTCSIWRRRDTVMGFEGQGRSPGAFATTGRWVDINNCQTRTNKASALDLGRLNWEIDTSRPGVGGLPAIDGGLTDFFGLDFSKETDTFTWTDCTGDSRVGLWKVKGSHHVSSFLGTGVIDKALEFVR
jgi:hypothetical protein